MEVAYERGIVNKDQTHASSSIDNSESGSKSGKCHWFCKYKVVVTDIDPASKTGQLWQWQKCWEEGKISLIF